MEQVCHFFLYVASISASSFGRMIEMTLEETVCVELEQVIFGNKPERSIRGESREVLEGKAKKC